ncbi:cilia- and flagella-associated protein 206 isoform X2 [Hyperolius riggenbachi]
MCPFTNVVASFKKHINLSSNKLIRCVLLNAAVELFGCLSSRSCNDFYWDMGYLYTPLPCTDALSWPNTDAPSTRLSKVAEAPTVHRHEDSKLISNELVEAGEVKAPLECVGEEVCAEPQTTPEHVPHWIVAPAIACLDENTELLNDSEVGVYLNFSFSHDDGSTDEMDVTPSVFWDSYDLHTSRSDTSFHLPNKMSHTQAESVIKNIIREIAQECAEKGHTVSETLVAFVVKAVVLDSRNGFNVDRTLTKNDVQKLIKLCVDKLLDTKSPSLETIKMQVYFDMNYTSRGEFLDEHHRVLESRLAPVSREITDSRARTAEELESLYRKIVSYVLLRSGLGSPTDIKVVREATAALQSVFPHTELGTFLSLGKRDKERQLKELTMIVTGIRLFNKDCGKGGEGIDDLPTVLKEAIPATTKHIDTELQSSRDMIFKYTALIEDMDGKRARNNLINLTQLKEALYNARQHEAFLNIILSDIITCAQQVEMMDKQYGAQMEQLRDTVQSKTAVPTAQVYPLFISLAKLWNSFQDEIVMLSVLSNMTTNLQPFLGLHEELFPADVIQPLVSDITVPTDEERIKQSEGIHIRPSDFPTHEWYFPENTSNYERLPIQYHGFCGFTIAAKDGLLLPGNPSIGILKHRERYYVFCSKEAASMFAQDPDHYISLIGEKAKQCAELIQLLELHQQFASITPYSQAQAAEKLLMKPITKCNSGTQTDTHFMESNIVKSYEWNEWELRRKAIKLTNLRQKVTHSMQTHGSHMRRENFTQVYLPKQVGTQTKRDGASNVPKPHIFLAGLRGCGFSKPTNMVKVNLTRDVEES